MDEIPFVNQILSEEIKRHLQFFHEILSIHF